MIFAPYDNFGEISNLSNESIFKFCEKERENNLDL